MTTYSLKATLSAAALCTAAFCSSAHANLVVNGGFETGDFTGWTQTGNTTFNGVQTPGPGPTVYQGNSSAFGPIGSIGGITQSLTTTPGALYVITFAFLPDGNNNTSFSASFGGTNLLSLSNPPASAYVLYSFLAAAGAGTSTTLAFNFRDDPGFLFLDAVAADAAPIPAALPLFATGLGALGLVAYRRRRKQAA